MSDLDQHLPAIAAGDAEAFAAWLAGAEPRIRLSLSRFAAHVDAEAVVQETLLRVWQVAPRFEPDGRANGLLRLGVRIARNQAISELRRRRVPVATTEALARAAEDSARLAVEPVEPDPALRAALAQCVEQLKGPPKRALAQRLGELPLRPDRELAERVGMSLNTFLQNVRRARKAVETCLARAGVRLAEVAR